MQKPRPQARPAAVPHRTFIPGFRAEPPPATPLRQLGKLEDALGVMAVALEHAAAPDFSNEGAALILRLIRREMTQAVRLLAQ